MPSRICCPVALLLVLALLFGLALASAQKAAAPGNPLPTTSPERTRQAARLNNLGAAYMNQQLFEKALTQFEQAEKVDPGFSIAQTNRGIALLNLQRVQEARQLLETAVKANPKNPYAWYNLGLLYKSSADTPAALDAFRRVTALDPNDYDAWYFIGSVHLQARQFAQAIAAFQHALELNRFHASAEFGLARALQQSGDTAAAKQHLARFQQITQSRTGAPISLAYGEQGKYSRAEESAAAPEPVGPAIAVKFIATTQEAGLGRSTTRLTAGSKLISYLGPGACFLDYDGDGKLDLFLAAGGHEGAIALYHNLGNGKFEEVTRRAGFDPGLHAIGCTAGDYDNDGFPDLAVALENRILLFHNQKNGTFKEVSKAAGIDTGGMVLGLTFVDYDHDGDLDLYVTRYNPDPRFDPRKLLSAVFDRQVAGSNVMWRNNGNGTFTNVTDSIGLAGTSPSVSAIGSDYNNDRAVDIIVTGFSPTIFENPREGRFRAQTPWSSAMPAATAGVAGLDFNHDGWMDIAFTHWGSPGLTLWRNVNGRSLERVSLPETGWVRGWGVAAIDYDNDGWIDLAAVGETADGRGEIRLFRNLGPQGFRDVSTEVGLDKIKLQNPRALITGDYDGDGATDLLVTQNNGPVVLLRNQGGNQNHWLRLALKGLNDNKSAVGTKLEVFAGGNRQKWEIQGSSGYLGQSSTEIIVGLGQAREADVVRMLWPSGVLQDEIEVAIDRPQSFTELDRRGSSCPTLFVWDGTRYRLAADMLGAGVVGHWVGPGERNTPRPTEYLKLDRTTIRSREGMFSFRLLEPMEEVVYLDQVRLLAIDHPSDVEVYPNEYFASNPPYPPFKVITTHDAYPPAGAWDEHGHNVLPDLLAERYLGDFELLPFKGFTKLHSLELDLGEPYHGGPLRLLLHGEIEYFTATGMYAADQAAVHGIPPYVEAKAPNGAWMRVVDDMGFPAGLPRTMVADLSGRLPFGTRRIRFTTNLEIYWNQILIDRSQQNVPVQVTAVPLARADLQFHGYPRQIEGQPPGNVKYVYEEVSSTGPYARQPGAYTRYGDVRELLAEFDDRLVVFGSGEEVALEFDATALPRLAAGWTRDYFFQANGYEKDMDFYAFDGNQVDPLPFRDMGTYPPARSFPADDEHVNYLLYYNTRQVSGNEPQGYSYKYAH